jgi:hypothetical protein
VVGRIERKGIASDAVAEDPVSTIASGSVVVIATLGIIALTLVPLILGSIMVVSGELIPGIIMLLFTGFTLFALAGWLARRYQGQLMIAGLSLLLIMGIIWAIFEDGYGPKAFMLSLVVTCGFMVALGFYNLFIAKRQPRMTV